MKYVLRIIPEVGPVVVLDNDNITSVQFFSEGVRRGEERDRRRNTLVVEGVINNTEVQSITIDHFILMVGRQMFAGVEVEMYDDEGKLLRKYSCDECFIQYAEHFKDEEGDGTFTLWAEQHPSRNDVILVEMEGITKEREE